MRVSYRVLAIVSCLIFATDGFSQAKESAKLRFNSFSVQFGVYESFGSQGGSLKEFKALVPESELLDKDFSDFDQYFFSEGERDNFAASVQLYFDWRTGNEFWNKLNPQLRVGLSHSKINLMNGRLSKLGYHRIDTLTSSGNGEVYYVDSVSIQNYFLEYKADILLIDGALTFSSNPNSRWSIYAGVGLSVGMIFDNIAFVSFTDDRYYDSRSKYKNTNNQWNPIFKEEVFSDNELGYAVLASLPLGLNFRLSKNNNF